MSSKGDEEGVRVERGQVMRGQRAGCRDGVKVGTVKGAHRNFGMGQRMIKGQTVYEDNKGIGGSTGAREGLGPWRMVPRKARCAVATWCFKGNKPSRAGTLSWSSSHPRSFPLNKPRSTAFLALSCTLPQAIYLCLHQHVSKLGPCIFPLPSSTSNSSITLS